MPPRSRRAIVVGGSLAGLLVGNLLHRAGWEVDVYERSPEPLAGRGAGIITHTELFRVLERCGVTVDESIGCRVPARVVLGPSGIAVGQRDEPQILTTWGRLHHGLLHAFPPARYHLGATLVGVEPEADGVTATFADGTVASAAILVAADGIRSTVRSLVLPEVEPEYAGYVGWRGLAREGSLGRTTQETLAGRFAFCLTDDDQMLAYPVAGVSGSTASGERDYNVVWYRPTKPERLTDLCTDATGRVHPSSIAPGSIRREVVETLRADADRTLAPQLAEIVRSSREPFFQAIADLASPRLAVGRVVLIGDAAFVARPHVGVGVVKAAGDAAALVDALARVPTIEAALATFEEVRMPFGRWAVERGRWLGSYLSARGANITPGEDARERHTPEAVMREVGVPLETVEPPGLRHSPGTDGAGQASCASSPSSP